MDLRKIDLRTKAHSVGVSEAVTTELSDEQLSSVSGGKGNASPMLMKACATGTHIREATITH
jgi:bacteriocin-like protein